MLRHLISAFIVTASAATAAPHWAFQPLQHAEPPQIAGLVRAVDPVDRFVLARLTADGRQPAPPADRRTLLRRASYDLTGLPPTPEETNAFLADAEPDAFARAVDRLLASPGYGEKWGRLWLDVVRYADTAGETADYPMPHAWRYRNWVIKALNTDLHADEFIRWQLAGDLLAADGPPEQAPDKVIATGYLGIARRFGFNIEQDIHLTYEDTIDTMGKAFLGLSIGCARCHDHKHDPISARDYYGLYGILQSTRLPFTGCEKTMRPRDMVPVPTPEHQAAHAAWKAQADAAAAMVRETELALTALAPEFAASPLTKIAEGTLTPGAAQTWTGDALAITAEESLQLTILPRGNYGADGTGLEWSITESAGEKRTWSLAGAFADPARPQDGWAVLDTAQEPRLLTQFDAVFEKTEGLSAWRGAELWPSLLVNRRDTPNAYQTLTLPAQTLAVHPGPHGGVAVMWHSPFSGSVHISVKVTEFDPGGDGVDWRLDRRPSLRSVLEKQRALSAAHAAAAQTQRDLSAREPLAELALAVVESTPVNAQIHKKGEPKDPGEEVPRKLPDILGGALIPAGTSGRRELADWLTRGAARALTARVLVNRIWLGHFGEGIVSTPNDFGTKGAPPSDPALLDWLAARLIEDNWSLKAMHRRLMLTTSYQRASPGRTGGDHRTAFFPRRRLTAEELRDTLLVLSGNLDRTPGGPHPFPPDQGWGFTQHNPFKAVYDHNQRSVYLMVQRTQRHPFLALFDAGDPNTSTPVRSQSTVPTQALYFLNDPFVHTQARSMAARIVKSAPDDAARLDLACREMYGRPAGEDDLSVMRTFLAATAENIPRLTEPERTIESWTAWLRVMFGTNELLYVD